MNIKMPKKNIIDKIKFFINKFILKNFGKVNTKKGQTIRAIIVCSIIIIILIALVSIVISVKNADTFKFPDNTKAKYLNEKNSGKIRLVYNSNEKKEQFLNLAKDIEIRTVNYYINTITPKKSLEVVISNMNKEFSKKEWTLIDMKKPKEWIGSWSADKKNGDVKFKFLNKKMEPNWIDDKDVIKYIIKN